MFLNSQKFLIECLFSASSKDVHIFQDALEEGTKF